MRLFYISLILFAAVASLFAADPALTSYVSIKPILKERGNRLPAELRNVDEAQWTAWSRRQDQAIRARLQQGDLDSMVNLLLFGTSFTKRPRIRVEDITEASKSGALRAR
jgi:hypothetical protein